MSRVPQPGTWRAFLEQASGPALTDTDDDTEPPSQPVETQVDVLAVQNPLADPVLFLTLEELLLAPGRTSLPLLHPTRMNGAGWFEYTKGISRTIKQIMENDYKVGAPNWTSLSGDTKLRWFKAFAQKYNWDYAHTTLVRENFDSVCATRLLDRVYEWKLLWRTGGVKPSWMKDTAWGGLVAYWAVEKNAKRGLTNSTNRNSNRGGFGIAKHTCGSCPYRRMRENMRDEATGELPDMVTFMERTHKRKADGVFVDKKAEHIARKCRQVEVAKLTQLSDSQDTFGEMQLTQAEKNLIYKSEVELKKGNRFGFGNMDNDDEAAQTDANKSLDYEQMYRAKHMELVEATKKIDELSGNVEDAVYWSRVMQAMFPNHQPPSRSSNGKNPTELALS